MVPIVRPLLGGHQGFGLVAETDWNQSAGVCRDELFT